MNRQPPPRKKNFFCLLLPYLWAQDLAIRSRVISSIFCLIIAKIISLAIPITYKHTIDSLTNNLTTTIFLGMLLAYGGTRIFSVLFAELRDGIFARVGQRAARQVALKVFEHMHKLSLSFHLNRQTGGISRSIERGVKGIETILRFSIFNIIPTGFEIVLVCGILWFSYGLWFSIITLITMIFYVLFTLAVSRWRIAFVRQMNESENHSNTKALDSLLNFETVKYFGNENYESQRFNQSLIKYENAAVKNYATLSALNIGQGIIIALALVSVMLLAGFEVQGGNMTIGDFVLVNTYIIQLSIPLNMLGFAYREVKSAIINMEDMFNLLDIPSDVAENPDSKPLKISKAKIIFDNVNFAYNPNRQILKGLSFTIERGHTLAIVGHSGSGKSTISRLIFRFYDVTTGKITIDGQDIRDITQNSLRQAIGIVPQDTVLFNDTIYYNIAYGNINATREEVINASKKAHIHEFITSLPEGYNTTVGERGLKLSGGEKQRIAIARTILKNPYIYIFDEATSSLDTNTEKSIQASLKELSSNHTTLIIAHRLSTIIDANEILVIDHGRIIERGAHSELLALNGQYAGLWYKQQSES
ncbi:ABC transporter ATP-binding protein/permease [Candidatus Tisiphia endosymbiont of Beris chalybata]|uniref:ABCB family ABC transporter ATP-binding protein/permease n=1 Tax=Candidatus Tisiphia endosymbiont of Beris chalybata TaxID=3066262 RepID=UPI00312CA378